MTITSGWSQVKAKAGLRKTVERIRKMRQSKIFTDTPEKKNKYR